MARRVLVTAATGTVGSATMNLLASDADAGELDLFGTARSETSAEVLRSRGFTPIAFDYDNPRTLRPALEGVDAVFLITGYTVDMLIHSKRLLDAAKAAGVRQIVHLGAMADHDTPHAHFGWHQLIERTIAQMGFDFTHLQPNFFMDTVWTGFRHRPDRVVHFVGDCVVSWVSAQDIAAVAAEILRNPDRHVRKTYRLAVEALSLGQIADLLSQTTGSSVAYRPRPASDLLPVLLRQGMEPTYAAGLAEGVGEIEAGRHKLADAVYDTVRQILGRPPITWRAFIAQQLDVRKLALRVP